MSTKKVDPSEKPTQSPAATVTVTVTMRPNQNQCGIANETHYICMKYICYDYDYEVGCFNHNLQQDTSQKPRESPIITTVTGDCETKHISGWGCILIMTNNHNTRC
jgi:hypothetical protein